MATNRVYLQNFRLLFYTCFTCALHLLLSYKCVPHVFYMCFTCVLHVFLVPHAFRMYFTRVSICTRQCHIEALSTYLIRVFCMCVFVWHVGHMCFLVLHLVHMRFLVSHGFCKSMPNMAPKGPYYRTSSLSATCVLHVFLSPTCVPHLFYMCFPFIS